MLVKFDIAIAVFDASKYNNDLQYIDASKLLWCQCSVVMLVKYNNYLQYSDDSKV